MLTSLTNHNTNNVTSVDGNATCKHHGLRIEHWYSKDKVQWVESRGGYLGTQNTDVMMETPRNQWFRYVGGVGVIVKT